MERQTVLRSGVGVALDTRRAVVGGTRDMTGTEGFRVLRQVDGTGTTRDVVGSGSNKESRTVSHLRRLRPVMASQWERLANDA